MSPRLPLVLRRAILALAAAALGPSGPVLASAQAVSPKTPALTPAPRVILAQTYGGYSGSGRMPQQTVSDQATGQIVAGVRAAGQYCARVSVVAYRIDCLSERLERVAGAMPATGEYAAAQAAIANGWRQLGQLARDYRAPGKQPARLRDTRAGGGTTSRPIVPVDTARLPEATARAEAILDEVQTVLLRSAENSRRRQVAFQEIAQAIDSNKVLLRSA